MTVAPRELARQTVPPGTRLGRYEIIADIASGGMATVFLGRALGAAGFQRLVAIKCLHPHVAKDAEFVGMFMDEARLAARIRHPNVVPTLDLENGPDGLFLVMEYVEGDSLLSLLKLTSRAGRKIPAPIAIRIVLDVLAGLEAAHDLTGSRGEPLRIVHRDVSPHNILVGVDGIARITDFGIARAEERISATREGQVKGKLAYMAPEQTSGETVDMRADLFAAGTVLWETLAGRRLFGGQTDGEVVRALLVNAIPRLKSEWPEGPDALDSVCSKALERERDKRYANAHQFAEALTEAAGGVGIASARAVATFVRETSAAQIDEMNARVHAGPGEHSDVKDSRPFGARTREPSDPERTIPRSSLLDAHAPDAIASRSRSNAPGEPLLPSLPANISGGVPRSSAVAVPPPPARRSSFPPPIPAAGLVSRPRDSIVAGRRRTGLALLVVLVVGSAVGGSVLWWLRRSETQRVGRPVVYHGQSSANAAGIPQPAPAPVAALARSPSAAGTVPIAPTTQPVPTAPAATGEPATLAPIETAAPATRPTPHGPGIHRGPRGPSSATSSHPPSSGQNAGTFNPEAM